MPPPSSSPADAQAPLAVQRIERVLDFADAFGKGLLVEFRRAIAAPPASVDAVRTLADGLIKLEALIDDGRQFLVDLDLAARTAEARAEALRAYPLQAVSGLAAELDGIAKRVRAELAAAPEVLEPGAGPTGNPAPTPPVPCPDPPAPAAGARPALPLPPGARPLAAGVEVLRVAPPGGRRPGAIPAPGAAGAGSTLDRARQAFDGARQLVQEVLAFVSPRLLLVKVAMHATGLPGRERSWPEVSKALLPAAAEAHVPQPQLAWLPTLCKLFLADRAATQKAHVALVHWGELKTLHAGAERLDASLDAAPPERRAAMLRAFNLARYRANLHPLSHLHVTFAEVPHLQALFPPP